MEAGRLELQCGDARLLPAALDLRQRGAEVHGTHRRAHRTLSTHHETAMAVSTWVSVTRNSTHMPPPTACRNIKAVNTNAVAATAILPCSAVILAGKWGD